MFIDSHAHLLQLEYSPEEAVRRAAEDGVEGVVHIGIDAADSRKGTELADALPGVYSTAGIHPHNAGNYTPADLEAVIEVSESPGVVAIGEVGLDYHRSEWSAEVQRALFEDAISLANDVRLPLVIHSRSAYPDTFACLSSARVPVVLHCFEGGEREVEEAKERGYYIGLAGNVTYKNSPVPEVLAIMDPEKILIETDSPFLSPQPVRGQRNEPKNVVHTARFVAERLGMSPDELGELTSHNARRFYDLQPEA
jgi:TatD DNase family protein